MTTKTYTYWELELNHTTRGWVGMGTVFRSKASAEAAIQRVHPDSRHRYRVGQPKVGQHSNLPTLKISL